MLCSLYSCWFAAAGTPDTCQCRSSYEPHHGQEPGPMVSFAQKPTSRRQGAQRDTPDQTPTLRNPPRRSLHTLHQGNMARHQIGGGWRRRCALEGLGSERRLHPLVSDQGQHRFPPTAGQLVVVGVQLSCLQWRGRPSTVRVSICSGRHGETSAAGGELAFESRVESVCHRHSWWRWCADRASGRARPGRPHQPSTTASPTPLEAGARPLPPSISVNSS